MTKISDAEMELMSIIWKYKKPLTSKEIMAHLKENTWKTTTVLTLLSRLVEKGYLSTQKNGRAYLYNYTITKNEYKKQCAKSFLDEFYKGSVKNFFVALYEDDEISKEDLEELKALLEEDNDKGRHHKQ